MLIVCVQVLQPGSYVLSVTLRGYHIKESPFNLVAGSGFFSDVLAELPSPPTADGNAHPRAARGACSGGGGSGYGGAGGAGGGSLATARNVSSAPSPQPSPRNPTVQPPSPPTARAAAAAARRAQPVHAAAIALDGAADGGTGPTAAGAGGPPSTPSRPLQLVAAQLEAVRRRAVETGVGMPPAVESLQLALDPSCAVPSPSRQFEASVAAAAATSATARLAASASFGSLSIDGLSPTRRLAATGGTGLSPRHRTRKPEHAWCGRTDPHTVPGAASPPRASGGLVLTPSALDPMRTLARATSSVAPRAAESTGRGGGGTASGGRVKGRGAKLGRGDVRKPSRPAWGVPFGGGGTQ